MIAQSAPARVIGDKAYDSDRLDELLAAQGVEMIAPNRLDGFKPKTAAPCGAANDAGESNAPSLGSQNYRRLCIRCGKISSRLPRFPSHGLRSLAHQGGFGIASSRATRAPLSTILEAGRTRLTRTMGTTIDRGIYLHSVSDNPAAAVRAGGRQRLNRTFKRIKCMRLAPDKNLKGLIVVVSAGFTNWHKVLLNLEEIGSVWSRALPEVCQLTRNRAAFVWSLELIFPSRGA